MQASFDSLDNFANFLNTTIKRRLLALPALELAAQYVEAVAKAELGTYQETNMGPLEAWEELAEVTKSDRARKGFTENDPLLRSGELKNSISHETDVSGHEAVIGSPLQKLVYLELGTKWMAPRSVLQLAAWRSRKKIQKIVGEVTVLALLNADFGKLGVFTFDPLE